MMSQELITTFLAAFFPALLVYLNDRRKVNTQGATTVFDKQQIWIEKLEKELEERDAEIAQLKLIVEELEKRIKELEEQNNE